MYEHILVPLDGSRNSKQALDEAIKLAKQFGSKLSLLTVINNTNFYYGTGAAGMPPSMYDDQKDMAQKILDDAKKDVEAKALIMNYQPTLAIQRTSLLTFIRINMTLTSSSLVNPVWMP